jgi:hypothetical protein
MSILTFPRIHFRGRFRTNPSTSNNNDVMHQVVDADHFCLGPDLADKSDAEIAAWLSEEVSLSNNPGEPLHRFVRSGWNHHGDFFTYFDQAEVTSVSTPEALDTSDPLIREKVEILGSLPPPNIAQRMEPVICDLESTGLVTSQIFIGGLRIGPENSSFLLANHDTRAYLNGSSVYRVVGKYEGEQNFVSFGCTWHFTIPKSALDLGRQTKSPGLNKLLQAAERAAGLAVRFATYEVEPVLTSSELIKAYKAGQKTDNPAYGYLVGTIGVWNEGEPTSDVAGRLLQPPFPRPEVEWAGTAARGKVAEATTPHEGQPPLFGSVIAHVQSSPRIISLDLIGCFPKDGFRHKDGFKAPEKQANVGTVELAYETGDAVVPIGDVDYGLNDFEMYAKRGGIVDVPYDASHEDAIRRGTLLLRGKKGSPLNAEVVLLKEAPVRVVTDDRALYLDPGEKNRVIQLHVTERGGPPSKDVTIYVKEYHSIVKERFATAARPDLLVSFQKDPRLELESHTSNTLTVDAHRTTPVPVKVSAISTGSAVLGFQLENRDWRDGLLPWLTTCYSNLRIFPADDFSALYEKEKLEWKDVYEQVLRYYHVLFPAMSRRIQLNDPEKLLDPTIVRGLLLRFSKGSFYKTFYMPITRSMSPGRAELLRQWLIRESPVAKQYDEELRASAGGTLGGPVTT